MVSAQEQVRQIKHGVADLINEQDLVKKIEKSWIELFLLENMKLSLQF